MCGLSLFHVSGEPVRESLTVPMDLLFGLGELDDFEKDCSLEVAVLRNEGFGNFEILSDRSVKGTVEEVMSAFRDLGFTILEEQCRRMFDSIQTSFDRKKKN